MGITKALDGADLVRNDRGVRIVSDGMASPDAPAVGPRIGISKAVALPWRWHVPANAHVSGRRGASKGKG
jgi:DNA-3-methyladenine glycosylase